ncbi:hypothetical protein IMCC3317_25550 [Kordia antarctica]|uniref:Methyltransferase type 11 domain-containing protein n=1 Tax=Kordia antarctica TaxID=1218801 RepID=A0A7L4ZL29_9FLAO|nr:methyltransferase domain-containing protein [Kordia antarctica]QHI37177.1 hypothetical protein IMCC3317_25550 [Kordia antarctica]
MSIDPNRISDFYNNITEIWSKEDQWHYKTYLEIKDFINNNKCFNNDSKILNAGSGGTNYDIDDTIMTHLDIASELINNKKNKIVGSIESIPTEDNSFTNIICVGSVINYCDPVKVLKEFSRVLSDKGNMILEYESSKTLELIFKKDLNKKVVLRETFYDGQKIILWYFSEAYISKLLEINGFEILTIKRFHIISALVYRITKSINFSSKFLRLDSFFRNIPIINKYSSNTILDVRLRKN